VASGKAPDKTDGRDGDGDTKMSSATRRRVLQHVAASTLIGLGSVALAEPAQAQAAPRVRRDLAASAAGPHVATYRAAVRYMRSLPSTDRRSWAYQTSIHRNWCPHRNWFFLPWHREYLNALEGIIRSLPEDSVPNAGQFAMPYWNWTRSRSLPAAFASSTMPDGSANPLHVGTRELKAGDAVPAELTSRTVMDSIYRQTRFDGVGSYAPPNNGQREPTVQGVLEAGPHNGVHNLCGGDMATMLSPRDPIFFVHHANIDRIWASWNRQGGANPTSTRWRDKLFSNNFARPSGALYSIRVRDISAQGYVYDRFDPAPAPVEVAATFAPEAEWVQLATAGPLTGLVSRPAAKVRVANRSRAALGRPASVALGLQGCRRDGAREAAVRLLEIGTPAIANAPAVRVFINHPALAPDTPPEGPHYVGTFSFFGTVAQQGALQAVEPTSGQRFSRADLCVAGPADAAAVEARRVSVELPLTRALQRLAAAGRPLGESLTVQLVPVALSPTVAPVEIQPQEVEVEFF
jgi:tyrosinase